MPATAPVTGRAPARVLLVDDSIVARAVLARAIAATPDLAVVAQAGSGTRAIALLGELAVDLIVLDLQMPGMSGLEALPALLAAAGGARVLIVSSAAGEGAADTVTALRLGAADTLLKPRAGLGAVFTEALVERLRRLAAQPGLPATVAIVPPGPAPVQPAGCIAIGASTGGVHALSAFFAAYPARLAAPILVTQHLPPPFMPHFARQLADMARRPVRVAADGMAVEDGAVLLAPGDGSLALARTRGRLHVKLERRRSASGHLPSVDPMFAAAAAIFGRAAIGVILSGMGRDGLEGTAALHAVGATVLAQDAASSVVWGMPGAVVQAGYAAVVGPPAALARRLEAVAAMPAAAEQAR